jgi:N-acetyl-gamma-glutamyl-phosphate reductase
VATDLSLEAVHTLYKEYYHGHPFTHLSETMIDIKQVVNTNKCLIHLEKVDGMLAIHSVTDNLIKGAAGQAIQNMNLMLGWDEREGLLLKGSVY